MKLPKMNIPDSEKDEDWGRETILAVLQYYHNYQRYTLAKQKDYDNYQIVDGIFDKKIFEYVTKAYGLTAPARLVSYNIILSKLDLLAGELMSQDLQFTTHVINRDAVRRKNEKKVTAAAEVLLRPIRREIEKALGTELTDEEIGQEIPADIETFKNMKFRDHVEDFVNIGLKDLIKRFKLKHTFKQGFYDLNITLKEFYRVFIKDKFPFVERLDLRDVIYDIDASTEDTEKGKFAGIDKYYSMNTIMDMLPDLDKKKVERLQEIEGQDDKFFMEANSSGRFYINDEGSGLKIRMVYLQWRALRAVKHRVSPNSYDPDTPYYKMVKDDYVAKKGEKVITKYIDDIWECYLIGNEIVHGLRRMPDQLRYEENYAQTDLDIIGIRPRVFAGSGTSTVDALKNIQTLYNITMYHIELAMARSGGRAMVYDVSQKPKGYSLTDVIHHAKNSGLIIINSQQEGFQTNGFNQFQQVDFSLSNSITGLINLKMMLEELADKITGISAARAGINKSGDLVGVNERNVMQSSLITLPLFEAHYKIVGKVLNRLAGLMKIAYADQDRMANLFGDNGMMVIKMDKSISLDEVSVYVENNGKEIQDKNNMYMALQQAVSSGQGDLGMIARAIRAESASEIERILDEGVRSINEVAQANKERDQQLQEQANEIGAQKIQVPLEVAKIKAETDIKVAQIEAASRRGEVERKLEHDADAITANNEHELDKEMLAASNSAMQERNTQAKTVNK
jgi:hypothetical protein